MELPEIFKDGFYVFYFTVDTILYLEMCKDLLYAMLNIMLAKRIVSEINKYDCVNYPKFDYF
jgi:hypothetical protein